MQRIIDAKQVKLKFKKKQQLVESIKSKMKTPTMKLLRFHNKPHDQEHQQLE